MKEIHAKKLLLLTIGAVNEDKKYKRKFENNEGHNILRVFDTIPKFLFTTGETKRNY